jgi:hypothetical protein
MNILMAELVSSKHQGQSVHMDNKVDDISYTDYQHNLSQTPLGFVLQVSLV